MPVPREKIAGAAGMLMLAMMTSRILGYVRDVLIYAKFGQNNLTDAYQAAFSIPDFLYLLLVGGVLSSAFIPVFAGYLARDQEEEAWQVASIIFNLVVLLMAAGITLGLIFTPQLMRLLVPGFDAETMELAVSLTRIMFFQAFFMAVSGVAMGVQQSYRYFVATAAAAVLYNLSIIVVGWLLSPYLGIKAFSLGVLAGALASFMVQVPGVLRFGLRYHLSLDLRHPGVRRLWRLMVPVLVSLSVTQLNLFVNQNLASTLSSGVVAALRTGDRLAALPIGTFATALAVAAFPNLTAQAAQGRMADYRQTVASTLSTMFFLMLPSTIGLITLGRPIIRLLFEQGKFTSEATLATSWALVFYAVGIAAYGSLQLLNRAFYAIQDTTTPMVTGVLTIGINIWLNITMVRYWGQGGLALAYSLAGFFNMTLLFLMLRRKVGRMGGTKLVVSGVKTLLASILAGAVVLIISSLMEPLALTQGKIGQLEQVVVSIAAAVVVFVSAATLLRMEEMGQAWKMVKRRLGR